MPDFEDGDAREIVTLLNKNKNLGAPPLPENMKIKKM